MFGTTERRPRAVLIAGATASGKSALAMDLAEGLGGAVVNADSMQVYRELAILTARPSAADEAQVPHRLYGHVGAGQAYSVARWREEAAREIAALETTGLVPIVTGGTGLYFRSLLQGLSAVPEIPAEIRRHWRERTVVEGAPAMHRILSERDPVAAARLRPSDAQRIARALEVVDATGRSIMQWQTEAALPAVLDPAATRRLVVEIDRGELHRRIDARFVSMVERGGSNEASALAEFGLDPALPAMRAIGVRPLIAASRGEIGLDEAIRRGQAETRQYAKRQETWFRNQMPDWERVPARS